MSKKNQKEDDTSEKQDNIMKPIIRRSPKRMIFTEDEDKLLLRIVKAVGDNEWYKIARFFPGKTARQCREHYRFSLKSNINRTPYTIEEDTLLLKLFKKHGPRWVLFQKYLKDRTPDSIKNRCRILTNYEPTKHYMAPIEIKESKNPDQTQ